ncbi:MAG: dihydroorotate dehydrogenase-like protein [Planctomycetota bacterium]|jgi:dihydroorotate dehydrogenase (fumarate)
MADLSTKYMGLKLANPLMVASCGLSKKLDGIIRIADSGAGAIVIKSLFEEQIQKEMVEDIEKHIVPSWHSEAYDYVEKMGMELGPREYLSLIEEAKKAVSIPVIASLNCISTRWWKDYAKQIETAGADGLELNVAYMANDIKKSGGDVEKLYFRVLERVKDTVNIPIAVKLGPYFTNIAQFTSELCKYGASALVLFNRFYQFDIDLENMELSAAKPFSTENEMRLPLKWIAQLSGKLECDLAASTGIHSPEAVVKQILAGAQTVQLCSVLYSKGIGYIKEILQGLETWMETKGFGSLEQMRGKLGQEESENPELYERLQYIKVLVGIE